MRLKLADGKTLETKEATWFEDLPWDAYIIFPDGNFIWGDGNNELDAIKRALEKAGLLA